MHDWNVIATCHDQGFTLTCELLEEFGPVARTGYYNVVVARVPDLDLLLSRLAEIFARDPGLLGYAVSRIVPARAAFSFQNAAEFEDEARHCALALVPQLAGKSFHVRMHRRGFKGRLSSQDEERFLDKALLDALAAAGTPGSVTFDDPDAIISIETAGNRAGLSLWTRDELARYPFLGLD